MKKLVLIFGIIIFNVSFFSCSTNDLAEDINIEELSTEGEDGQIEEENDD